MYSNIIGQNNEGEGITKINGIITFVPFTLKGDVINLNIIKKNKKYNYANYTEILKKSIERKEPLCQYYYECGGCNLMHQIYKYQLNFKIDKVKNNFKHICNIEINNLKIEYDNEYKYRNHITLSVEKDKIGFYKNKTNQIIDINSCLIASEIINKTIKDIKLFLSKYPNNNIKRISIKSYDQIMINIESDNFILIKEFKKYVNYHSLYINNNFIDGKEKCTIHLKNIKYKISNKSFFQKNTNMTIKLYDYIKDNINKNENILDLYCGVGSIGIYVGDKCNKIVGIEITKEAILDAIYNAKLNNIKNIKFICGKAEENLDNITNIDTIVVDPPRVGLNKKAIKNINKIKPQKIIYVSCNSTTLCRDINLLKEKYKIDEIKLFDLFPNTFHVECVCLLKLR